MDLAYFLNWGDAVSAYKDQTVKNLSGYASESVPIEISAVLGSADVSISNLLKIGRGAVIELNRKIGEMIELKCQNLTIGQGEVHVIDGRLAVEITEMYGKEFSGEHEGAKDMVAAAVASATKSSSVNDDLSMWEGLEEEEETFNKGAKS